MAEEHKDTNYMAIFWWLLALTILEVLAAISPIGQGAKATLLVVMALAKAILVAMYFMHLRFETRTLAAIVVTPLVLCVFLLVMLFPDMLTNPSQTAKTWGVEKVKKVDAADTDDDDDDDDDDEDDDEDD